MESNTNKLTVLLSPELIQSIENTDFVTLKNMIREVGQRFPMVRNLAAKKTIYTESSLRGFVRGICSDGDSQAIGRTLLLDLVRYRSKLS